MIESGPSRNSARPCCRDDLDPEIGHHRTKIGARWTVSPRARLEFLDLLLEENHRRHAAR